MCFGLFVGIYYNKKDLLKRWIKFFNFTFSAAITFSNGKENEYYTKKWGGFKEMKFVTGWL